MGPTIHDLPDVILSVIVGSVSDTRTRNAVSLVSRKFHALERATRTSLVLRGNARDLLYLIPTCFRAVTHLDLSLLSPWGYPLPDHPLLAHRLRAAFPLVSSLTLYARSPSTLHSLLPQWPLLTHVRLVRWHQRSSNPLLGADISPILEHCPSLSSLDLSAFYYWTEDVPHALQAYPDASSSLTSLDLLTLSLSDGFKASEIRSIAAACPNLARLRLACMFDPSYMGFVADETLLAIAAGCPRLRLLHLVDAQATPTPSTDHRDAADSGITRSGLVDFFAGLPLLEDLTIDVCKNVREAAWALEALHSKCPNLQCLKLGQFQGLCVAPDSQPDGLALCSGLISLSICRSLDLTDMGLIQIGRGCSRLAKFEVQGCNKITVKGVRTLTSLLHRTLAEVSISFCQNLGAVASLRALEPVRHRIQMLHLDCLWDESQDQHSDFVQEQDYLLSFDLNQTLSRQSSDECEYASKAKRCKYSSLDFPNSNSHNHSSGQSSSMNGFCSSSSYNKSWEKLKHLSLWIGVGELLTPLPMTGLDDCPNLEEIRIKVEGDCRGRPKPSQRAFGLSCLACYPRLTKMQLDCSDTIGFALTAPSGQMDLSLWERFFLNGIDSLNLYELDYWPPQDRDVNQRSLTLPGAALIAECPSLRKLFIHGTAHEHFMMFFLKIPNLRDVQLREDYYPAPENDMSTEMRVDSCSRFEDALNSRRIAD
ncbi:hypothetical protein Tsubulata_037012 [Turnera subulata]|uniref:COI1 F-box domain-containing protein n=1 Tax=Turnera subulata TaxID=218843 RepID=A0A9Q0F169_9ROSI|nr:hypothetical protein Tsubulata_037012 [Turnera subulata]